MLYIIGAAVTPSIIGLLLCLVSLCLGPTTPGAP
jgi:hypothetical protein